MVEILELVGVAAFALVGSGVMWLLMVLFGLPYLVPRMVEKVGREITGVSDVDIEAANGDFFKAMTKKQGDTFAQAIYGAMGNIVQTAPTGELDKLAQKYGFSDAKGAVEQLQAGGGVGGNGPGLTSVLAQLGGSTGANGRKNSFAGIVDLMVALQALGSFGGGAGGMPGLSALGGGGGGSFSPGIRGR